MTEREQLQAQQEAKSGAARVASSAERARLWAGMNRYLAAEAAHAHRVSDDEAEKPAPEPGACD
ncbi:hypothetical protein [Nocardioides sp. T2.26MG-1]|uniref:hypothetical protein n=1 Tax=Nocardioides sp. T2.26MG-1 TaxID=3041166 RepID=UPI0024773EB0|nr:hypothetical protein [Nocardioides sp. T2.26MG-1]CAI9408295.1 hypothetical protein HIDPHFAB_01050 [Nocardioides sp. T2.26MG-1]